MCFSTWHVYMQSFWMHPLRWNLWHHANVAELDICWEEIFCGRLGHVEGWHIFYTSCMFFENIQALSFPWLYRTEVVSHKVIACWGSRLSCICLRNSVALWCLIVKDIFDVQCLKFWYKFVNNKLPNYFRYLFKYNYELHDIGTRSHHQLHLYPTHTRGARNVLGHHIPDLLNKFPQYLIDRIKTQSIVYIYISITILNVTWLICIIMIIAFTLSIAIFATMITESDKWFSGNLGLAASPWSPAAARLVVMTASEVSGNLGMVAGFRDLVDWSLPRHTLFTIS